MGGQGTTALWRRALERIEALDGLGPGERVPLLQALREQDAALHARVVQLLAAEAAASVEGPATTGDEPDLSGREVGAYRFLHPLGQGGMGRVWAAERADGRFEGRVAIKLLALPGGGAWAERFAREGRLLARLAHPHIARLIDAGTLPGGPPYLVLEHVDGQRIDAWCDAQRLTIPARVALLLQVCEAVAHAHANLVVHRDLKPSNILVDRAGSAKLLDFGIAKLLDDDGAASELSRVGGGALTPSYAAPEQIEGGPITTATDVYALGVVLYRLLSGRRPYGETAATPLQWARAIVEAEPPPLSARPDADQAARCGSTPDRLRRTLRGDLDTIVAKALKKDPAQRYAGVQALADDLRRWLAHEPVLARPDTWRYRSARFVRRHRSAVLLAALAATALVAATSVALWQAREAQRAAGRAVAVQDFLVGLFQGGDLMAQDGRQIGARELLARGAGRIASAPLDARTRHDLYGVLGHIYERSTEYQQSLALRSERLAHARAQFGAASPQALEALEELAGALRLSKRYAEAEPALRELIAAKAARGDPALGERRNHAGVLGHLGRAQESAAAFDDLFARLATVRPADPVEAFRLRWLELDALDEAGRWERATELALAWEDGLRAPPPGLEEYGLSARLSLVDRLIGTRRLDEARSRLGPLRADLDRLAPGTNLLQGWVQEQQAELAELDGDLPAAIAAAARAHVLKTAVLGVGSVDVRHANLRLARLMLNDGRVDQARTFVDGAWHSGPGASGPTMATLRRQTVRVAIAEGRAAAAREQLAALAATPPATPRGQAALHELEGALALLEGDAARARASFEAAIEALGRAGRPDAAAQALLQDHLAQAASGAGPRRTLRYALH